MYDFPGLHFVPAPATLDQRSEWVNNSFTSSKRQGATSAIKTVRRSTHSRAPSAQSRQRSARRQVCPAWRTLQCIGPSIGTFRPNAILAHRLTKAGRNTQAPVCSHRRPEPPSPDGGQDARKQAVRACRSALWRAWLRSGEKRGSCARVNSQVEQLRFTLNSHRKESPPLKRTRQTTGGNTSRYRQRLVPRPMPKALHI